ncbi:MAG: hypothetical protein WD044_07940 [Dongiaceae bacterium]
MTEVFRCPGICVGGLCFAAEGIALAVSCRVAAVAGTVGAPIAVTMVPVAAGPAVAAATAVATAAIAATARTAIMAAAAFVGKSAL